LTLARPITQLLAAATNHTHAGAATVHTQYTNWACQSCPAGTFMAACGGTFGRVDGSAAPKKDVAAGVELRSDGSCCALALYTSNGANAAKPVARCVSSDHMGMAGLQLTGQDVVYGSSDTATIGNVKMDLFARTKPKRL